MATLRRYRGKRGTTWILCWHVDGAEHRKSLGPVTYQEAERRRKAMDYQLTLENGSPYGPTLARYCERYLAWHETEYPDSHWRIRQICRQYLIPFLGDTPIGRLAVEQAEAYKQSRTASPTTIAKELRVLQAILNRAVTTGDIARNPIASVKAPRDHRDKPPPFYSRAQLAALYEASDPLHAAIWRLYANTGMRRAEGLALRREDIRQDGIYIMSTSESRTKSGKWRKVPVSAAARSAIKHLLEHVEAPYLIPRWSRFSLSRAFANAARRAGIGGSLHWLRHTYASHQVMAGTPLRTIQALLGHATIATTEQYAHLSPDHLAQVVKLRL